MTTDAASAPFAWTSEVGRGAWIAEGLDGDWDDELRRRGPALGDIVPVGFDALIRVLHPFSRDRPATGSWADYWRLEAEAGVSGDWDELPGITDELVSWRAAAEAHGGDLRPGSLAFRLLGFEEYGRQPDGTEVNADGWRYGLPAEGDLEPESLAAVARVLAEHTGTPARGIAAVWEGWGGLVSAQGVGFFGWPGDSRLPLPVWAERLRVRVWNRTFDFRMRRQRFGLRAALHAVLLPGVDQPDGSGVLPREAAAGLRLELPNRAYICFEAGIADFAVAEGPGGWCSRAPWIDGEDLLGACQGPNLIWPEDRAWFLISEIDFDSTLIACSRACADALLAASGVEAVEITRDTPLWDVED